MKPLAALPLWLLLCCACDAPQPAAPPAAPAPSQPATPAPPAPTSAPTPDDGSLGALLTRALAECKVIGSPGSRPLGCDPLIARVTERAREQGAEALPDWAAAVEAMTQRDVAALSWLAGELLAPVARELAERPEPRHEPAARRIIDALTARAAALSGLHLFAEPVASLASAYTVSLADLIQITASHDPLTSANLLRASMRQRRTAELDALVLPYMSSSHELLAQAALEAPWQMGAWSDEEARAICAAYATLAPPSQAPRQRLILRAQLACSPAQQQAALKHITQPDSADADHIELLIERCSPHPFAPWPRAAAPGLCDSALKAIIKIAQSASPSAPAAAAAIAKGWPTPAGEAALKQLAASDDAQVQAAAASGLQLIQALRDLKREAAQRDKEVSP